MSELDDKITELESLLFMLRKQSAAIDTEIEETVSQLNKLHVEKSRKKEPENEFYIRPGEGKTNSVCVYPLNELPENRKIVDRTSKLDDKYALFLSLFEGRPDVHAKRFYSKKQNKPGYAPHCLNWYKLSCPKRQNAKTQCKDCDNQCFSGITKELFVAHAKGDMKDCSDVLGAYPLDEDGMCTFIVADFDNDDRGTGEDTVEAKRVSFESMRATALAFHKQCICLQIPAHLEISRSGYGMHVWLFFSERVSAMQARRLFSIVLTQAMEQFADFNMEAYDRFIPQQDILPKAGFGNLIALPLQGRATREHKSIFVDEEMRAFSDQMQYLSQVRKLSAFELESMVSWFATTSELGKLVPNEIEEELGKPWERKKVEAPLLRTDFYGSVKITYANMLHIEKRSLSPRAQNKLRRLAAFKNPEFYENQRMRLPTWNIPRIITTAEETEEYLSIPRGAREELIGLLNMVGVEYDFQDLSTSGVPLEVEFAGALRDDQPAAAAAMLRHDIGVLSATTAFGKTVIGAYLIAQRKVSTLILVHTTQLLDQWKDALSLFLDIRNEPATRTTPKGRTKTIGVIGQYGAGKKHCSFIVDVVMIQSLHRKQEVPDFVKDYGMVIVDECHWVPAPSFEMILKTVSAKYVYGLTATPMREDGHHAILFLECGPIRYKADAKAQAEKRPFEHYMIPRFTNLHTTALHDGKNALTIWNDLAIDEQRNELIVKDVIAAVKAGRYPLVLSERVEHVNLLADALTAECENVIVLIGADTKKAKREALERLANLGPSDPFVIVATGKYVGEGFDFPRLDTLFLTLPFKAQRMVTQYIGRLHRLSIGKEDVRVYDYVDIKVPSLERQYLQRIKGYKAAGYKVLTNADDTDAQAFIYDNLSYWDALASDCRKAKRQIVFSSPSLTSSKVAVAIKDLSSIALTNVITTVITKPSSSYKESMQVMISTQMSRLRDLGMRVYEFKEATQRFAIIDQTIVWFGNIDPLGYYSKNENFIRVKDIGLAAALLDEIKIDCLDNRLFIESNGNNSSQHEHEKVVKLYVPSGTFPLVS